MSLTKYLPVCLFTFIAFATAAQQQGYIIIDSTYATGVIFEQGNDKSYREVKFAKSSKSPSTIYYPATVKEYGYSKETFVSRKITTGSEQTDYFLRVLAKGKTQLFTVKLDGKKRFFLENEEGMIELKETNDEYQQTISSRLTKCEDAKRYTPHVNFSEKALRRYFTLYNTCYEKGPWPLVRWGVTAGYAKTTLNVVDVLGDAVELTESSPFAGLHLDLPMGIKPTWFLNMQLLFQQSEYQESIEKRIAPGLIHEVDYTIETSTVSLPIVFKYCWASNNLKGFVTAGASINYHFKNESKMVEDLGGGLEYSSSEGLVKKAQANGIIGAGAEYFLSAKNSLGLEVRYNKGAGIGGPGGQKVTATQVLLSFSF